MVQYILLPQKLPTLQAKLSEIKIYKNQNFEEKFQHQNLLFEWLFL